METGVITKIISNRYHVRCGKEEVLCVAMGKLRKGQSPVVGDQVLFERFSNQNGIQKILPRKNELRRPFVANVDQAIIVMSAKDPDFSLALLYRLIFQVAYAKVDPVLCITKLDCIQDDDAIYQKIDELRKSGYTVIECGWNHSMDALKNVLKDKISVLTGQSGAGKSSLLNRLDPRFQLKTQEISKALGRGKHTTRHCELYEVANGWVADTPGFSSLDFTFMDMHRLQASITDFQPYQNQCRFKDCLHQNEPDCKIKDAVASHHISKYCYEQYLEVLNMIQTNKKAY